MKSIDLSNRHRHGGNLRQLSAEAGMPSEQLFDFSANLNPLGPPEWLRAKISAHVSDLVHYPDPDCSELLEVLAEYNQVSPDNLLVGNGATELLYLLPRALDFKCALIPVPSYADYEDAARLARIEIEVLQLDAASDFEIDFDRIAEFLKPDQLVLLGQPNNPTGRLYDVGRLRELAKAFPRTTFLIDESFIAFVKKGHSLRHKRPANVIVVESMTKAYAIPGLRLGYLIADAEIVTRLRRLMPDWTVNTLAQRVGCRALADHEYRRESRDFVARQRLALFKELTDIPGLKVFPGDANFLLLRLEAARMTAEELAKCMLAKGIAIRVCDNFKGLDQSYFRVAVRSSSEQDRLCRALQELLAPDRTVAPSKKTPAIMFQGTGSNAGKSVLTAAMCRILHQDGYEVAPFKAQNMSLNSFVTRQGAEMGRAQVVQAQACRLEPDVRMNPVLLKPNSDTGSQVVLNGKVCGNMHFRDYADRRQTMFETVMESYDALAAEHDVMVLEGAGSPAEINLKARDIVNMNMARYADAPVLLVGDIDRGGVFASFVGTMELLSEAERDRIAGFVINRFRGDQSFLTTALEHTLHHTGKPVFGVVPYLKQLGLPEEDSVSFKSRGFQQSSTSMDVVDVAVVDLPHISNFTDFDALSIEPDVSLRVVRRANELGKPDALILPGSKNVLGDLAWLQDSGLATDILQVAESDATHIIGICGGLQILGEQISDPHGIESDTRTRKGLALLPIETTLAAGKTTVQMRTSHLPSGHELVGYEIHHGHTKALSDDLQTVIRNHEGEMIGGSVRDNRIWGTYLHGVFDGDEFRRWFIDRLRLKRGWNAQGRVMACYDLEPAIDRLADTVRQALDIKAIYRRMGL
jgi:cobyric acid synthase CobQ/L-threonine-O-3-phosphate decarboxylase